MLESNVSIATNHKDTSISFDEIYLSKPSVYLGIASGRSMENAGIYDKDLMLIDRALSVKHMDIIIVFLNNCFYCKYADLENNRLLSANDDYPPVQLTEYDNYRVEGVLVLSIRPHRSFNFESLVSG